MRKLFMTVIVVCWSALLGLPAWADKHERWFEARSQNFVVVCNAGEKQARKTDVQFEQIRALFRKYLVVAADHPSRVITILAAKDENSMKDLLPEYWAKGHMHPAGLFFGNLEMREAAVQVDAEGTNPYAVIYHEYYHSLTLPYYPGLPLWLAEGLADFFGYSHIQGEKAYMGETPPELLQELRLTPLIPLDTLLKVDRTSPYYNENQKTGIFYAESWALTHYLMMADKGSHRPMLSAYLGAVSQPGVSEEKAAASAFGDVRKLQSVLQQYITSPVFYDLQAPAPEIPDANVQVRELSEAEADAYLGGFAALRGRVQDAKPLLEQAIKLDPNVAMAYQNLGVAQYLEGDRKAAYESFSKAVSLDPKNALTHYFRAYLSLGQEAGGADDPRFDDDLRQAIALDPSFAPAYQLLASHLTDSSDELPEALSLAKQAVTLEPGNSGALLALARVLIRMRNFNDAQTVAEWAEKGALNAPQREAAEQMLNYVQQARNYGAGRGPAVATNSTAPARAANSDEAEETEDGEPGGLHHATGVVTESTCVNGVPQIELKTESGVVALHGAPGGTLDISVSFRPPAGFDACTLKGYRAVASYTPDDASGKRGTVTGIRVLGSAPNSSDGH